MGDYSSQAHEAARMATEYAKAGDSLKANAEGHAAVALALLDVAAAIRETAKPGDISKDVSRAW
jgi:hypothetical protein